MCRRATLAMLVSITSMKVASETVSATNHGLTLILEPVWPDVVSIDSHRLSHLYARLDGHSGREQMIFNVGLAGIEDDFHRHALYDFHVIPRRIFRWEQAEAGAAAVLNAVDFA